MANTVIPVIDILDQNKVQHIYQDKNKSEKLQEAPISSKALTNAIDTVIADKLDNAKLTVIPMDKNGNDINEGYHDISKIGFGGQLSTVQYAEEGRVNIFIRQSTDYMSLLNATTKRSSNSEFTSRYLWSSSDDSYFLPENIVTPTKPYNICIPNIGKTGEASKISFSIEGDKIEEDTKSVVSYDNVNGKLSLTAIFPGLQEPVILETAPFSEYENDMPQNIVNEAAGLSISWDKLHIINNIDIRSGKTPNTVELTNIKFTIEIKDSLANAYMQISAAVDNAEIPLDLPTPSNGDIPYIVVYKPYEKSVKLDTTDRDANFQLSSKTERYVSGIKYISAGTFNFKSATLLNSCYIASAGTNRFKVSPDLGASGTTTFGYNSNNIYPATGWVSDTKLYLNNVSYTFKEGNYFTASATLQYSYYDREGTLSSNKILSISDLFYNKVSKATSKFEDFITENNSSEFSRKFEDSDKTIKTWVSEKTLANSQGLNYGLLVQNGNLYWPCKANDTTTQTYKDLVDPDNMIRTYLRKFWDNTKTDKLSSFTITIKGKNLNLFANDDIKIYIWPNLNQSSKDQHAMRVNKKIDTTSKLAGYTSSFNGICNSYSESNGIYTINCEILPAVMSEAPASITDGFWLLIEAKNDAKLTKQKAITEISINF